MALPEERLISLEHVFAEFVEHTGSLFYKLTNEMLDFKDEMREFKNEMLEFKNTMTAFKKEQDEEWKKWRKEWSNLSKRMGTLVEDLIAPALGPVLSKYFGCKVTMQGQRQFREIEKRYFEIDAIAGSEDRIFMVEARTTPRVDYVNDLVNKRKEFFTFFPEHKCKKLEVIYAGITFTEQVIEYASKKGIYVMAWREWEYMDLLNFDQVQQ